MKRISITLIISCLLVFSCGKSPYRMTPVTGESVSQISAKPASEVVVKSDIFTPKELVQNAIKYLQIGQAKNAYIELQKALKREPGNGLALKLVKQITSDPNQYFNGDTSFIYTIKVGDSLSTISKKYLKDPYKFYILSRYNQIENPSLLSVGQTIKVPGSKPKDVSSIPSASGSLMSDSQIKVAQDYMHAGNYQSAIDLLERGFIQDKLNKKIQDLLVLSYTNYSQELATKDELLEAHTLLKKALTIQPNHKQIKVQIKNIENQQEADRLYMDGLNFLQSGNDNKAYSAFKRVLKLVKSHTLAKKQITTLESGVDSYYREGMAMYRRQNLKDAIALFDKVLLIDSNHEMARAFRARATDLQTKLNKLNNVSK